MPLRFGTSGVRGLVTEMTDLECYFFTLAFLRYARVQCPLPELGIAGDLRPSTPRILVAVAQASEDAGFAVRNFGGIPTPALCLAGITRGIPTIMVTGSHIPDDRNGIKFNLPSGEILKRDEPGILQAYDDLKRDPSAIVRRFDERGGFADPPLSLPPCDAAAAEEYCRRYLDFYPARSLQGKRVGVYQHSAVGRDLLTRVLDGLGAEVVELARSDDFVAVDTEAVGNPDQLAQWVASRQLDALVGTDGDSDRPLVVAENGRLVHGDLLGMLTARYLRADSVVVPVSCNSGLEQSGMFSHILRTRIGSPFVIEGMQGLARAGRGIVVGFEANGGFLLGTNVPGRTGAGDLTALPTRDALLPILTVLHESALRQQPLSELVVELPARFTVSGLIKRFPLHTGHRIIALIRERGLEWFAGLLPPDVAPPQEVDFTDGARIRLANGGIVHLRPSGNAPEFRCYTEADCQAEAQQLNQGMLPVIAGPLRREAEKEPEPLTASPDSSPANR